MKAKRQKNQMQLAFCEEAKGEARSPEGEGSEAFAAKRPAESRAETERLMEEVVERENLKEAWQRVKANKGSPGVDGRTVHGLPDYLKEHGPAIREQLLGGSYQPQPVKRVEIPNPDGGVRTLGIPTVRDRLVQTALRAVPEPIFERDFAAQSYGFRPNRGCKDVLRRVDTLWKAGSQKTRFGTKPADRGTDLVGDHRRPESHAARLV